MERPRRSTVKKAPEKVETKAKGAKRKNEEAKEVAKKAKVEANHCSDSESSSDEFVRVKTEPGPLKLKEDVNTEPDFSAIESNIFDGVTRLSDSDSDSDFEEVSNEPPLLPVSGKVEVKVAEADSVSEAKITPRAKLQLAKLTKSVLNGLTPKEEKEYGNDGSSSNGQKSQRSGGKSKPSQDSNNGAVRTSRRKTPQNVESNEMVEDNPNKEKSRKSASNSKAQKKAESGKKAAANPKEKSTSLSAKVGKGVKIGKTLESEDSKSRGKRPTKAADKKQVPSTSLQSEIGSTIPKDIDNMDMNELLALGENLGLKPTSQTEQSGSEHSDEGEDWEEVNAEEEEEKKHVIPKEGVQITLEMPELIRRRRKHKEDIQAQMNRQLNRVRREFQILFHKCSVLCWLAHGFYINGILNKEELLAVALSLIPSNHCMPAETIGLKYVKQILEWFVKLVDYSEGFTHIEDDHDMEIKIESLQKQFSRRVAKSRRELVFMFVCILRAVGVDARLIISLQPMPLKPQSSDLMPIKPSKETRGRKSVKKERTPSPEKKSSSPAKKRVKSSPSREDEPTTSKKSAASCKSGTKWKPEEQVKNGPSPRKTRSSAGRKSYKEETVDSDEDSKPLSSRAGGRKKKESEEPILSPNKKVLSDEDRERLKKAAEKRMPSLRRSIAAKKKEEDEFKPEKYESDSEEEGDSDFTPESRKKAKKVSPKVEVKRESSTQRVFSGKKKGKKVLSSSEEEKHRSQLKKKVGCDYWVEVYIHKEEGWIPVDVARGKVNCVDEIKVSFSDISSYRYKRTELSRSTYTTYFLK